MYANRFAHNAGAPFTHFQKESLMIIPWQSLSQDALQGIIEDYVTREGTDYGGQEFSLARKVEQVLAQLQQSRVVIVFDAELESCSIMSADQVPAPANPDLAGYSDD